MNLKEYFFHQLKRGIFQSTYCTRCKKFEWPLTYNCRICFGKTIFKEIDKKGILLEKTYSNLSYQKALFGIGEFSSIRLLGTLIDNLDIGDEIKILYIGIKDDKIDIRYSKV